jgi:hypothetical protein
LGIVGGGHNAGWFVEHYISTRGDLPDRPAIDGDLILLGVDACAGNVDDLAVHRYAAGTD